MASREVEVAGSRRWVPRRSGGFGWPRLLAAQSSAFLGDGLVLAAFPLLAVHISRSPSAVAGVGLAATLPQVLVALPAGVVTDGTDRRHTMAIAAVVAAAVLGGLALTLRVGIRDLALLDGAAFLVGATQVLVSATGSALMPQVAVGESLTRANARLFAAQHAVGSLFGPPMAGVLIAVALDAPAWAAAGCYLAAATVLASSARRMLSGRATPARPWQDTLEGIAIVVQHVQLRTLMVMTAVANVASETVVVVLVLYAVAPGPLGLSKAGYGFLLSCFAIGGMVGASATGRLAHWLGRSGLLAAAVAAMALGFAATAFVVNPFSAGVGLALAGAGGGAYNVTTVTFRQRVLPEAALGRGTAAYRLVALGAVPLGAVLAGISATLLGPRASLLAAGAVALLAAAGLPFVTESRLVAAENHAALGG